MRVVSENGYVDVPYEIASLTAEEVQILPFDEDDDDNHDFEVRAYVGDEVFLLAYADDYITARRILDSIRRHCFGGEQVVYVADIIEEVTRRNCIQKKMPRE